MDGSAGRFCWVDLATPDAGGAERFYGQLFGWSAHEHRVHDGRFTRLRLGGADVGSLYQLSREQLEAGVPSHWTAYVRVGDSDEAARRAVALGGRCLVPRFEVPGLARIALVTDPGGASFGLWQDLGGHDGETDGA